VEAALLSSGATASTEAEGGKTEGRRQNSEDLRS
jgi:hypothetical protein